MIKTVKKYIKNNLIFKSHKSFFLNKKRKKKPKLIFNSFIIT